MLPMKSYEPEKDYLISEKGGIGNIPRNSSYVN